MVAIAVDFRSDWSRSINVTGARVSEIQFRPNLSCRMHWHRYHSLGIVLDGVVSKRFANGSTVIDAGKGFAMPASIVHGDHFGPGSRVVMIEIDPDHPISRERLNRGDDIFEHWRIIEDRQIAKVGQLISKELLDPSEAAALEVDALIFEALTIASRSVVAIPNASTPEWLDEAKKIAGSQLHHRISVAEIAGEVGVHPAYLARRFREAFGESPAAYARNSRLRWAAERLIDSRLPIAEIAMQAGFSDQSHFTRAFRRYFSQTPGQYRFSLRPNSEQTG